MGCKMASGDSDILFVLGEIEKQVEMPICAFLIDAILIDTRIFAVQEVQHHLGLPAIVIHCLWCSSQRNVSPRA